MKTVAAVLLVGVVVIGGGVWAFTPASGGPDLGEPGKQAESDGERREREPTVANSTTGPPTRNEPGATPTVVTPPPTPVAAKQPRRAVEDVARECVKRHDFGAERRERQGEMFLTDALVWIRRELPRQDSTVEAAALDEIARLLIQHRAATLEWQKGVRVDPALGDTGGQAETAGLSGMDFARRQAAFRRAELQKFADTNLKGLDATLTKRFATLFDTQIEQDRR